MNIKKWFMIIRRTWEKISTYLPTSIKTTRMWFAASDEATHTISSAFTLCWWNYSRPTLLGEKLWCTSYYKSRLFYTLFIWFYLLYISLICSKPTNKKAVSNSNQWFWEEMWRHWPKHGLGNCRNYVWKCMLHQSSLFSYSVYSDVWNTSVNGEYLNC